MVATRSSVKSLENRPRAMKIDPLPFQHPPSMPKPRLLLIALASITTFCCHLLLGDQESIAALQPGTGIEGSASISPIRGGPSKVGVPNSAPLRNTEFVVENRAGLVVPFKTDEEGRFRVPLSPGRYTVRTAQIKAKIGKCGPFEVEVEATGFKKVQFACDSGMR